MKLIDAINYWTDNLNFPEMRKEMLQDYRTKKAENSCSTSAYNAKRMDFIPWLINETQESIYCQLHDL